MELSTHIQNISEDALESLFSGKDIIPSTQEAQSDVKVGEPAEDEKIPLFKNRQHDGLEDLDLDKIYAVDEKKEEPKEEDKKEEPKEEAPKEEDKKEEPKEEDSTEDTQQINKVLKTTVDYLVEKGYFKDFDGREALEVTDEVYADLVVTQLDEKLSDMFDEVLDSTGEYGKAIINHIRQNGNPDDIIDLFKEQKRIENFDVSEPKGQQSLIKKYYSEVVGWKDDKIQKYISTLEGSETGLEEEAKEVQSKYDELHQKQLETIKKEQAETEQKQKVAVAQRRKEQQEYVNNLVKTIDEDKSLTVKDKKIIKEGMLKFNKKLDDSTPINEFFYKFYEKQKDPKQYVELVHFVLDKEGYDKKVRESQAGEEVKNAWKFVKNNGAVKKNNSGPDAQEEKKTKKLDFSGILNR